MLQREDGDVHRERVYNFLALPFQFEKVCMLVAGHAVANGTSQLMWFGFGACLESFLFLFTYGPLRAILSLRLLLLSLIKGRSGSFWSVFCTANCCPASSSTIER